MNNEINLRRLVLEATLPQFGRSMQFLEKRSLPTQFMKCRTSTKVSFTLSPSRIQSRVNCRNDSTMTPQSPVVR